MTLDASAKLVLDLVAANPRPSLDRLDPVAARAQYDRTVKVLDLDPRPVASVRDIAIDGADGPLKARLYHPENAGERLPLLVYFHGGGWVIGTIESHDSLCRELAIRGDIAVLSVDYRLAPEHRFPAAVDDAHAAFRWAARHAATLGIDPGRIAVGGDSAGGNLAAVTALRTRNEAHRPAFQLLLYPATDLATQSESHRRLADGYLLTAALMDYFSGHYLGDRSAADHPDASPILAADFSGLPPAWVLTAGYDPLHHEGEAYAEALSGAGIPVRHRHFPGQIHGFLNMGKAIPETLAALDEGAKAVGGGLRAG
ncbi:alpha/beta hydrolase [Oceanibacterium hippocampi]|uniref:Carboxylesterase NlhH n=1 Tax=Oceanibacterium hippocampi TaxID=745714 RepID=A0A1Y5R8Q2_9PROT|nr:alpha/beta hydrolase [Oceanibacterium hippocampi]SLN11737.1 Carboxylesterase NlhH [Oceanibacterium hippocampi]